MQKKMISLFLLSLLFTGTVSAKISEAVATQKADSLLRLMTLDEKIGQMVLYSSDWDMTGPMMRKGYIEDIRKGNCGNIFNAITAGFISKLQKIAVEETRLKIPLLFGYDVIHGYRTTFPLSLGESCSWDLAAIEKSARVSAIEASAAGLNWTFAPMVDITVDPRWGRVSEGAGEDPYLGSKIAAARVHGFQGDDLSANNTILACVKHYAAYGAPQGGRDYNTVDMSNRTFLDTYFPPYKAAIDAGVLSVMTSFNEFDGVPSTANTYLVRDLLKGQLNFSGFVVTDHNAIKELINHGVAKDEADAGLLAIKAGIDMDMQSGIYSRYLKQNVESGKVDVSLLNDAVRRVLKLKFMLGLFEDPYRYCDVQREKRLIYAPEHLDAALDMAKKSFVLLKNDHQLLPLKKGEKIAVIGALANSKKDLLGSWIAAGGLEHVTTIVDALKSFNGSARVLYAEGCKEMGEDRSGFEAAISTARKADKIVMVLGEDCDWTGEASSRTDIRIPGVQTELLQKLKSLNKPIVLVLMNGRPLDLSREVHLADAILETWYPGTMGGRAVAETLFGQNNPSGKLTISFPRSVGQIPVYYYAKNTGRPIDISKDEKYKSRYLDSPNDPLFPFGFGLSYTSFDYSPISLSDNVLMPGGTLRASVVVTNTGKYTGQEVVQCYVRDLVGSVTRPVKQLKGFEKITLNPGESKTVSFEITPDLLAFHRLDMSYGTEPGDFKLFIGTSSAQVKETDFVLQ